MSTKVGKCRSSKAKVGITLRSTSKGSTLGSRKLSDDTRASHNVGHMTVQKRYSVRNLPTQSPGLRLSTIDYLPRWQRAFLHSPASLVCKAFRYSALSRAILEPHPSPRSVQDDSRSRRWRWCVKSVLLNAGRLRERQANCGTRGCQGGMGRLTLHAVLRNE